MKTLDLVKPGKFLSLVLRHRPELIGIHPDPQGWVDIDTLLDQCRLHGKAIDHDTLKAIVATNSKQRYMISEDGLRIRANQGHSIAVEFDYQAVAPPAQLFHGTATQFIDPIFTKGLLKQKRHHVHLSADLATAEKVGIRHGQLVVLTVDSGKMHEQGFTFYCTPNGVWLTEHVPAKFLNLYQPG